MQILFTTPANYVGPRSRVVWCPARRRILTARLRRACGIAARQRNDKKTFTDSQIIEGFMKTAFGAEYHLAGRVDRIRKYHMPVRVFIDGSSRIDRRTQIGKVVNDIAKRVQHLDIAITNKRDDANTIITLVRDRDLQKTITSFYGEEKAKEIKESLDPQCLSGFRKNDDVRNSAFRCHSDRR